MGRGSLTIGWFFAAPLWIILVLALTYGTFVTADSGALSTGVTEAAEPSRLGATLALQSSLGFLAAATSPAVFGFLLDLLRPTPGGLAAASPWQWGPAFGLLGLGVLFGPLSMLALRRTRGGAMASRASASLPR